MINPGESSPSSERSSWEEVRNLILLLTRTNSSFKIFPPEHVTVKQFVSDFCQRLTSFLEKHNSLDLIVGEHYFEFMGEKVFEDEDVPHSLPFFFFRDGLRRLSFHRGLKESELYHFFETIKEVASRPPDEADIVSAFWEKNFENISFYAPDEFIIEKIASGRPLPEYEVHPEELFSGKIELTEEDRKAIKEWAMKPEGREDSEEETTISAEEDIEIKEEEWKTVGSIIHSYRELPQNEELARLVLEVLYLEDRLEQLPSFKASLHQIYKELLRAGKIGAITSFLRDLIALKKFFSSREPQKAELIETFLAEIGENDYLTLIRDLYYSSGDTIKKQDWLDYLQGLDQTGLLYLATIYESYQVEPPPFLDEISMPLLEKWADHRPEELMKIARQSRPYLSRLIIRALARHPSRQVISFLGSFIRSNQPILRREALEALSLLESASAQKIMLGYLYDQNEEIRIAAARMIKVLDETVLAHLLKLAKISHLKQKSDREIEAFLEALAQTNHPKVKKYFQELFRLTWLFRPKIKKIAQLAIDVLKRTPNAQAKELLQEIKEKGRSQLRKYCQALLKELNSNGIG